MIELFFITCLAGDPKQCQDRSLLFANEISVMTCMLHGQTQLAEWSQSHPRDEIRKWQCRLRGKDEIST